MSDISKARAYLRKRGSDLAHLESFGLMLATAEKRYREFRAQYVLNRTAQGQHINEREAELALDYAVLYHLRHRGFLPPDVAEVLAPGVSAEKKMELAKKWINS